MSAPDPSRRSPPLARPLAGAGASSSREPRVPRELAFRLSRGDREAFGLIFERYQDDIFRFCLRMVGEPAAAEDLVQEIFLKVLREARRYDPTLPFEPWLYRVARNATLDFLRRRGRRQAASLETLQELLFEQEAGGPGPLEEAARREREALLAEGLGRLRPSQREVLVLVDLQGLRYEEVASILGISVKAVGARLRKARRRLLRWAEANAKKLLEGPGAGEA